MNRFLPTALLFVLVPVTNLFGQTFSANVVGYADLQIYPGSNLVANPLNAASNTVGYLFGKVPDGSVFLPWNQAAGAFGPTNHYSSVTGWSDPDAVFVQPNAGFLVVPSSAKISFHGESWASAPGPFCLTYPANESYWGWFPHDTCGICEPESCPPFSDSTTVSSWNAEFQVYEAFIFFEGFGWVPSEPVFGPAQGFQLLNPRVAFGRSPFRGTLSPGETVLHGRPFGRLRDVQRSGTNVTFRLGTGAENGYSLLRTTNLVSGPWQILEQGSNNPVTYSIPAVDAKGFFKVHPPYNGPHPFLISRTRAGSSFSFDFFAPSNSVYAIERLTPLPVQVITTLTAVMNTLVTFVDHSATNAISHYRVSY
jgi:hypothetical protein